MNSPAIHPWHQDLANLLQGAQVRPDAQVAILALFDQARQRELQVTLDAEGLLQVASRCSEIAPSGLDGWYASYWNNETGEVESQQAPTLTACMCRVADVIYNGSTLIEEAEAAFDRLLEEDGITNDVANAAWDILRRVRKQHTSASPASASIPA